MKELPHVSQTPDCGISFELTIQKTESNTLDTTQIEDVVVVNPLSNEIEINTDDLATYEN